MTKDTTPSAEGIPLMIPSGDSTVITGMELVERTGLELDERKSTAIFITALCKDDKEQMNRIEEMLTKLTKTLCLKK